MNTTTTELPDDAAECCRAAIQIMLGDTFEPDVLEAGDALEIAWAALAGSEGITPTAELARMLERAGTAMQRFTAELDKVRELVRHGTGDHRELDQRIATLASGRPPPSGGPGGRGMSDDIDWGYRPPRPTTSHRGPQEPHTRPPETPVDIQTH